MHALRAQHRACPWHRLHMFFSCATLHTCVSTSQCLPLIRHEFSLFSPSFFYFFPLQRPCRTFTLAQSTPFVIPSFQPAVVRWFWFHFDIGAHHIGTSSPSASDIRGYVAPPPCPCFVSVDCSRSCLFDHSGIRFGAYGPSIKSVLRRSGL